MKKYVLVFVFDGSLEKVLLVQKNRPEWQRGHLNGVGGHVEEGESFRDAAYRELEEETGLGRKDVVLRPFARVDSRPDYVMWVYQGRLSSQKIAILPSRADTGESLEMIGWEYVPMRKIVPDVAYLVPLAHCHAVGVGDRVAKLAIGGGELDLVDTGEG